MRFIVAMMQHETNTFSSVPTPLSAFGENGLPPSGEAALEVFQDTNTPFAAFVDIAKSRSAEIVVPIAAYAEPSKAVETAAFEYIAEKICAAVSQGADALFLDLHGAMVTEAHADGEGELLARIRAIDPKLPIAVALDFHTHFTRRMADNASVICGYRTYPHIDMYETGERAGQTLIRQLEGAIDPVIRWRRLPMITSMVRQGTNDHPMRDLMAQVIEAESRGDVLNASLLGGFPLSDVPYLGLSPVVVTDRRSESDIDDWLRHLCHQAWEIRDQFVFQPQPISESITQAVALRGGGPVILAEHGDNCGAGGSQDSMEVIAQAMERKLSNVVAGPIADPVAIDQIRQAGIGAQVTLALGGKVDSPAIGLQGEPLSVTARIQQITDGKFTISGPMMTGCQVDLGCSAVLDTGDMRLLVTARRHEPYDPDFYRHAGIEPLDHDFIIIKSRHHFRAAFEPLAKAVIVVAGRGVCSEDLTIYPFTRLEHPIYPIDARASFDFHSS